MFAKRHVRGRAAGMAAFLAMLLMFFAPTTSPWAQASGIAVRPEFLSAAPDTLVAVTTTDDTVDGNTASLAKLNANPGGDRRVSLREALLAANATPLSATLTIAFDIPASDPGHVDGVWTLTPGPLRGALPTLTRGHIVIDGTTQPSAAAPAIVLDGGDNSGVPDGIAIQSSFNVLRGLAIQRFYYDGVLLSGPANGNQVVNSVVQHNGENGIMLTGGSVQGNSVAGSTVRFNGSAGVSIGNGAHDNTIGGAGEARRNIISGNRYYGGVFIHGASTHGNRVEGNWVGVDGDGRAQPNTFAGVRISGGAHDNTIGGAAGGAGNVISGNDSGISIEASAGNVVAGNIIGLAPDGLTPLGNLKGGVLLVAGANNNLVGGVSAEARNVISSNGGQGVHISDAGSDNNRVQGNYIGVDQSGVTAGRGNSRLGVLIAHNARSNLIGGDEPAAGNVIVHNGYGGIRIDTSGNKVSGNLIGVGADRVAPLGNQHNGLQIGGNANIIGPANTIANNKLSGVLISGSNTQILSNTIEVNLRSGLCVVGAQTTISGNTIRNNGGLVGAAPDCAIQGGVVITGTGDTLVVDNIIHDNRGVGVTVRSGVRNSILRNSIGGNTVDGIRLEQGGNREIAPPMITRVDDATVVGRGCPSCLVEIFTDFGDEGRFVAGTTRVDPSGSFQFALTPDVIGGPHVTATVTDGQGNTSPFAEPVTLSPKVVTDVYYLYLPQLGG